MISGRTSEATGFEGVGAAEGSRDCERSLLRGRGRRASDTGSEGSEGAWTPDADVVITDVDPVADISPV